MKKVEFNQREACILKLKYENNTTCRVFAGTIVQKKIQECLDEYKNMIKSLYIGKRADKVGRNNKPYHYVDTLVELK